MINMIFFISYITLIVLGSIIIALLYRDGKKDIESKFSNNDQSLEFMEKENTGLLNELAIFKDKITELKDSKSEKEKAIIDLQDRVFTSANRIKELQLKLMDERGNADDLRTRLNLASKELDEDVCDNKNHNQEVPEEQQIVSKNFVGKKEQIIINKRIQDKLQLL